MAKPVATAASTALPPFSSTSTPILAARASCATTMPLRAVTPGSAAACGATMLQATTSKMAKRRRSIWVEPRSIRTKHHAFGNAMIAQQRRATKTIETGRKAMPNISEPTRRKLLQATAAAAALPTLPMLAAQVNAQGATQRLEFNPRAFSFSVDERDRRWAAVRAIMARPAWNLEAIITAASDLPGNTARYVTQIGMRMGGGDGAEVIFPRDPAQAVYVQVSGTRFRDFWKAKAGGWMADGKLAVSAEGGAQALAKQMAAQGLNRPGTRIGVAKLAGSRFD